MALLSLGLHRYEPLNSNGGLSLADTPKPDEQRAPEPGEAQNPSEVKADQAIALESGSGTVAGSGGQKDETSGNRTGESSALDGAAAQISAKSSAYEGVSQDNWSEKGIEIIHSVLRDAETRVSRSARPLTSETS